MQKGLVHIILLLVVLLIGAVVVYIRVVKSEQWEIVNEAYNKNRRIGKSGPDYQSCDGILFYGECDDLSCVDEGLETRVYNIWREEFMKYYQIDLEFFNQHVELTDVSISEGPKYVFAGVEYVYKNDWVRSRQVHSSYLVDYPIEEELTDKLIIRRIRFDLGDPDKLYEGNIIPYNEFRSLSKKRVNGKKIDYDICRIEMLQNTGELYVRGIGGGGLDCTKAAIDLVTGETSYYEDTCVYF